MNRRLFGACGVVAVVAFSVGGCKSDPLSDLDGNPADVVADFSYLQMPIGSTVAVTASVLDARTTPLEIPVTFTACTNDITVAPDPTYNPVPRTSSRAIVTAVTANPSCVRVAGGGIEDTVQVAVLPQAFNGTASSATPMVGQPFSLYASSLLGFNVNSANIDFGGGVLGEIIRRVGDTLTVRVPQPDATPTAPLSVLGVAVKYVPGLTVDLLTAGSFTVTSAFGDRETLGTAVITIPADGDSLVFWDGFRSGANGTSTFIDYFYQYTLASPDTLVFRVEWDSGADVDMANCNAACSAFVGGFGAATGANPETYQVIFAVAGTYNLLIESFDDHDDPAHLFKVTIRNP